MLTDNILRLQQPGYVSYDEFCKNNMQNQKYSVWDWLNAIIKLITENLDKLWIQNHIKGFITKKDTNDLLKCQPGTFLLRFSETNLGKVRLKLN